MHETGARVNGSGNGVARSGAHITDDLHSVLTADAELAELYKDPAEEEIRKKAYRGAALGTLALGAAGITWEAAKTRYFPNFEHSGVQVWDAGHNLGVDYSYYLTKYAGAKLRSENQSDPTSRRHRIRSKAADILENRVAPFTLIVSGGFLVTETAHDSPDILQQQSDPDASMATNALMTLNITAVGNTVVTGRLKRALGRIRPPVAIDHAHDHSEHDHSHDEHNHNRDGLDLYKSDNVGVTHAEYDRNSAVGLSFLEVLRALAPGQLSQIVSTAATVTGTAFGAADAKLGFKSWRKRKRPECCGAECQDTPQRASDNDSESLIVALKKHTSNGLSAVNKQAKKVGTAVNEKIGSSIEWLYDNRAQRVVAAAVLLGVTATMTYVDNEPPENTSVQKELTQEGTSSDRRSESLSTPRDVNPSEQLASETYTPSDFDDTAPTPSVAEDNQACATSIEVQKFDGTTDNKDIYLGTLTKAAWDLLAAHNLEQTQGNLNAVIEALALDNDLQNPDLIEIGPLFTGVNTQNALGLVCP